MEKKDYHEVRNSYNNHEGFYTIDAWKTANPNEEGQTVAVVEENSGNVYFINSMARDSKKVQNAIRERLTSIFEKKKSEIMNRL